jgi:hypothetical protein
MNYVRRYTNIQQEKVNADQEKILDELTTELTAVKAERGQLKTIAVKRREEIEDMKEDLDDAYGCIQKLEQARIVLNKLMGPEGVITLEERKKFNLGMPQMIKKKKPMLVQGIERLLKQEGKLNDPNQRRLNVGAMPQGG